MPINLQTDSEGDINVNKEKDVIFVLSSSANLMFYQFNENIKGPQALIMPYGETINAMNVYLPALKKFDDLDIKDWIAKAENSEQEFAPSPEDDKNEANRKESLQRWYSLQRFILEKKYYNTDCFDTAESMVTFVQGAMTGKVKNTFDSSPIEAELKNSL